MVRTAYEFVLTSDLLLLLSGSFVSSSVTVMGVFVIVGYNMSEKQDNSN